MSNRLEEVLSNQEANYILPFIWQRGEDESTIREEMARIHASGIRAVCVEARPHPDFIGPRWWHDLDIIMEEARARGMRVWVLDDDHFPTGHAAGQMEHAPAELRRSFLRERHIDVIGPRKKASFLVKPFMIDFFQPPDQATRLHSIIAARRDPLTDCLTGEMIDLTSAVQGDFLYWEIPSGCWRIFFLITSPRGGSERHADYVNPLLPESVRVLIDAVYEPHYAHYKDDFGGTFAGFFSDEPGLYNDTESFDYHSALGKKGVALPWRADMLELLAQEYGSDCRLLLPLLWHDSAATAHPGQGPLQPAIRYAYMNIVSRLYGEHFTQQIGDWCRAHRVEYIGHVLEDNGVHSRLGCGAGHYFRALWGQDMAGLDVVLWQLAPGFDEGFFTNVSGEGDGEFYHYGLAKMGSSLGHMDPKKQGRSVCEVFGAYGWTEGLKLMKWMTDHMLVRGVNYFVPHAFSQAEFPDPDCPPHMYARGMNPQYRYYHLLNHYTNRVSHLLSGGLHVAPVAVLYHAEAEWSGKFMTFHQPVKALMQQQIDCDVLPADLLLEAAEVSGGLLKAGGETFRALVIPYCQAMPEQLMARLADWADKGLPVVFIDRLPERASDCALTGSTKRIDEITAQLAGPTGGRVLSLEGLAQYARALGWVEIDVDSSQPYLRAYHVRHPGLDVYMFTNEHPVDAVDTNVTIHSASGPAYAYDAFLNRVTPLETFDMTGQLRFSLHLSPYESTIILSGEAVQGVPAQPNLKPSTGEVLEINGPWKISTATSQQYPEFTPWQTLDQLHDLSQPALLPNFSGTFRYETEFEWSKTGDTAMLDLGEAYETAEVWINSQPAGVRICPPYRFELHGLKPGKNKLVVELTNTLVKEQQDYLSRFTQQEPSGLLGPVEIR